MNTRADLLAAIRRDRAADLPRLAFADYLQENGLEPEREEFIRVQVDVVRLESDKVALLNDDTDWLRCTELSAAWCPNCGDCVCKNREESMSDDGCPLHAADSPHGCADELNRKLDDLRRREMDLWQRNCLDWFPFAEVNNDLRMWDRGFVRVMETNWNFWSANAAQILPEHPGLERVVLTTFPNWTFARDNVAARLDGGSTYHDLRGGDHSRSSIAERLLKAEWGGDPADGGWGVTFELPWERQRGRYVLSVGMDIAADAAGRAVPVLAGETAPLGRVIAIRPNQMVRVVLFDGWGTPTQTDNDIEIGFLPDDPDAHGGQYRHWDQEITRAIMGPEYLADEIAREEVAATERIVRDLLAEHGIAEDDLRSGRRQVTRLTTTDGRPPGRVLCECQRSPITAAILQPERDLEEIMNRRIEVLELRERTFVGPAVGQGDPEYGDPNYRRRYRVADGICPRCNRLYFAVTRVEQ